MELGFIYRYVWTDILILYHGQIFALQWANNDQLDRCFSLDGRKILALQWANNNHS
jgi:hypothetical protein